MCANKNYGIDNLVIPIGTQNVSQTEKMKCAEVSLLTGVMAPNLAVHVPIDWNFDVQSKFSVLPHSCCQPGKCVDSLPDLSVDLIVSKDGA